jgi:hypothetical protein
MSKKQNKQIPSEDQVQGEGDYKSAEAFNQAERDFVRSGGVEQAAGKAEPESFEEAEELKRAEEIGRSHADDITIVNRKSVETDGAA